MFCIWFSNVPEGKISVFFLSSRPSRCYSAQLFVTAVTWSEPGRQALPDTDTSSDLQSVPDTHTHSLSLYAAVAAAQGKHAYHTAVFLSL